MQLPIFGRKKFDTVAPVQTGVVSEPTGKSSILMTLPAYVVYLQNAGYSRHTPGVFHGDIKQLGLYLRGKTLEEMTPNDIKQWIAALKVSKEKVLAPKTISRKISAVNNYLVWLMEKEVIRSDQDWLLRNMRVSAPLPDVLFEIECQRLLESARNDPRSYFLVLLLLETGIKKEELLALQTHNFDFSNKYAPEMLIKHEGRKVKKDRKLKLPAEIVPVFSEYVREYAIDDTLFPYTPRFIELHLARLATDAKIHKKVSANILRDTCAVRALKRGEGIELVLTRLGLSPTTWEDAKEKYLKLSAGGI